MLLHTALQGSGKDSRKLLADRTYTKRPALGRTQVMGSPLGRDG